MGWRFGRRILVAAAARLDGLLGCRGGDGFAPADDCRDARVKAVHDIRTRKMGDLIVDDAHIEVDAMLTVEARRRAKSRSREVAKVMGGLT